MAKSNETKANHWVLVNKKTGKVASSNDWLLALAAHAHCLGDTSGIAGLLPQEKAKKSLVSNQLSSKTARPADMGRKTDIISEQAISILPLLAVMFVEQHPNHNAVTRESFCRWVTKQLADDASGAYSIAIHKGLEDLIGATAPRDIDQRRKPRSERWWLDQIKKMQS